MSECQICCEKYNQQLRSCVSCPNAECSFTACKTCVRTYIMNSTSDPHCMNCRKTWDQDFIVLNLNRSFYENTYKIPLYRFKLILSAKIRIAILITLNNIYNKNYRPI